MAGKGSQLDVVWFEEAACRRTDLVGGKTANLSQLAASFPVPPGFCITTGAYRGALPIGAVGPDRSRPVLTPVLRDTLAAAYQCLAGRVGATDPSVAVRSSAADEDGGDTSFAGQHDTYLNVRGARSVAEAVERCWASADAPRALDYRRRQGLDRQPIGLAVLVQQLITADIAAVVFSANPITGRADEIVINASWGLGESIVGGTVTPDTYILSKERLAVTSRHVAEKRRMTVLAAAGTREVDVPRLLRSRPSLDDARAAEVAGLARSLEQAMGWPVDVECAFRDGKLYLLQCRPITTLGKQEASMR
jgi:pyruvate,water dikinase